MALTDVQVDGAGLAEREQVFENLEGVAGERELLEGALLFETGTLDQAGLSEGAHLDSVVVVLAPPSFDLIWGIC